MHATGWGLDVGVFLFMEAEKDANQQVRYFSSNAVLHSHPLLPMTHNQFPVLSIFAEWYMLNVPTLNSNATLERHMCTGQRALTA